METPPDYMQFKGRDWDVRCYLDGLQYIVVTRYTGRDNKDKRRDEPVGSYFFMEKQEAEEKFVHMVQLVIEKSR